MNNNEPYVTNEQFRRDLVWKNDISSTTLYREQEQEISNYNPEVYKMVSQCFTSVENAAFLLSANGMLLKYAGPTIRSNLQLVKVAVQQNGDAIVFVSQDLLLSDPAIAADLILSAALGHPCEAFTSVIQDDDYIFEVSKKIVEMDNNMVSWVSSHMYANKPSEVREQMYAELSSIQKGQSR